MFIVAVDLAARFSAVVIRDDDGKVQYQWDSYGYTHTQFTKKLIEKIEMLDEFFEVIVVIEDLPQRVPWSTISKNVATLQGRIKHEARAAGVNKLIYWVPPTMWQRPIGVFRKGIEVEAEVAKELGYEPPDLLAERNLVEGTRGQSTAIKEALKQKTDYIAAFLISEWARRDILNGVYWDTKLITQDTE